MSNYDPIEFIFNHFCKSLTTSIEYIIILIILNYLTMELSNLSKKNLLYLTQI